MAKSKMSSLLLSIILFLITILLLQVKLGSKAQETTKDEIMEKLKKFGIEAYEVQFSSDDMYSFRSFSIRNDFFHIKLDEGYLIPGKTEKGVTVVIFPNEGQLSVHAKNELADKVKEDFGKAKFKLKIQNAYVRLNPQDYSVILGKNEIVKQRNDSAFQKALKLNKKKFEWYNHAWHLATFPPKGLIRFNLESDDFDYIQIFTAKNPSVTWLVDREKAQRKWPVYTSRYFRIHFPENSPIKEEIDNFALARDENFERANDIMQINFKDTIDLYVYNSLKQGDRYRVVLNAAWPEDKQVHCALGGSFDHEIVHVMAYYIGNHRTEYGPIVEGLSEYLGKPDVDFDAIAASHVKNKSIIPLDTLFDMWSKQNSLLSYPQAGSFVKFLIEEYGVEKFKTLWTSKEKINVTFNRIYSMPLKALEGQWRKRISLIKPATLSPKEKNLLKSFVQQLDDILGRKDKSAIKALTSKYINEGIARTTEINLEKIFALNPIRIRGTIIRTNLGSGSLVSTEVNLKIERKKDDIKNINIEYIFRLKDGECRLWMIKDLK